MGTLYFFFHVSNIHERFILKTSMTFEKCLVFMVYVDYGFNSIIINIDLHKSSNFVHAHVD